MLKYLETKVVFREIPDEITLAVNITNCPIHCRHCHSKHLWADIGSDLSLSKVCNLITENIGITCICFMGGDNDTNYLNYVAKYIKSFHCVKTAWYSGQETLDTMINLEYWDYIKIGPYIKEKGPLNNPNTNQRLYRIDKLENKWEMVDITNKMFNNYETKD